jgi:Spy/CpxP family protein refolding chaperone
MTERAAPWQNPRVLTTLLLVFAAGAASGALWMGLDLHGRLHKTASAATKDTGRKGASDAVLQNFKTKLDLSTDQTQKIALVLDDYRHYYDSLQDQLDDLRATGKNRILDILDPTQREKFEKMMAELAPQLQSGKK